MTDNKLNIYQRLHAIMKDVGYIQKENKKVNNQYTFVSHDAVTAKIRPSFLAHGVMAIPNFFDISQDGNKTHCSVGITFVNIDNPEDEVVIDCAGFGQGIDPQDKGAGKAMSYAYKYALLKTFGLETGDDPERDNIPHVPEKSPEEKKADWLVKKIKSIASAELLEKFNTNPGNTEARWVLSSAHPELSEAVEAAYMKKKDSFNKVPSPSQAAAQ